MGYHIIYLIFLTQNTIKKGYRKEKEGGDDGEKRGGLDFEGKMHSHLSLACLWDIMNKCLGGDMEIEPKR